jgi:hypothetical protein
MIKTFKKIAIDTNWYVNLMEYDGIFIDLRFEISIFYHHRLVSTLLFDKKLLYIGSHIYIDGYNTQTIKELLLKHNIITTNGDEDVYLSESTLLKLL